MLQHRHIRAINALDAYWQERVTGTATQQTPPTTCFHYTGGIEAVEGVVGRNTIWFGDARQMNDKVELRYALRLFRRLAARRGKALGGVAENFVKGLARPNAADSIFERFRFYSASFGQRDSRHMWRKYARGGRGFAIGIDPSVFAQGGELADFPRDQQYFTGRVRYNRAAIRALHRNMLDHATSLVLGVSDDPQIQARPQFLKCMATMVHLDAVVTALTSKEPKWRREQEQRLYLPEDQLRPPLHEVRPFRGRDYIHMSIPKEAIVEVMLGPNTTEADREKVDQVLADAGYSSVRVTQSALSLPRRG